MSQKLRLSKPASTYSILFGAVDLSFPKWESSESLLRLPLTDYYLKLQFPGIYFASLFYLGVGALGFMASKNLACIYRRTSTYLRSFGNARRF